MAIWIPCGDYFTNNQIIASGLSIAELARHSTKGSRRYRDHKKEGLRERKEGLRERKEGLRERKEGLRERKEGLREPKEGSFRPTWSNSNSVHNQPNSNQIDLIRIRAEERRAIRLQK